MALNTTFSSNYNYFTINPCVTLQYLPPNFKHSSNTSRGYEYHTTFILTINSTPYIYTLYWDDHELFLSHKNYNPIPLHSKTPSNDHDLDLHIHNYIIQQYQHFTNNTTHSHHKTNWNLPIN